MENTIDTKTLADRIIPITYARRNFGAIAKKVIRSGFVIITINGIPALEIKNIKSKPAKSTAERLMKYVGCLKGTIFEDRKSVV